MCVMMPCCKIVIWYTLNNLEILNDILLTREQISRHHTYTKKECFTNAKTRRRKSFYR